MKKSHPQSRSHTLDEALKKMQRFCSYQERCHQEVNKALEALGMIELAKAEVIRQLVKDGFLNEQRYVRVFVNGKFTIKKWGRIRLRSTLKHKDISDYLIKKGFEEIEDDYLDVFKELSESKMQELAHLKNAVKRKKLTDYLLYRGWEPDLVYDRVRELIP